ncbi:basic proline-rich protein-like [Mauremys reevesii]|uniref:basic proline-rich protein-like n=1 Tax=Mauremys reevesii TaxID=260615 RepID=UPI00193F61BF|nr:basic proline-rich protein-like [Mauremys reevesii]
MERDPATRRSRRHAPQPPVDNTAICLPPDKLPSAHQQPQPEKPVPEDQQLKGSIPDDRQLQGAHPTAERHLEEPTASPSLTPAGAHSRPPQLPEETPTDQPLLLMETRKSPCRKPRHVSQLLLPGDPSPTPRLPRGQIAAPDPLGDSCPAPGGCPIGPGSPSAQTLSVPPPRLPGDLRRPLPEPPEDPSPMPRRPLPEPPGDPSPTPWRPPPDRPGRPPKVPRAAAGISAGRCRSRPGSQPTPGGRCQSRPGSQPHARRPLRAAWGSGPTPGGRCPSRQGFPAPRPACRCCVDCPGTPVPCPGGHCLSCREIPARTRLPPPDWPGSPWRASAAAAQDPSPTPRRPLPEPPGDPSPIPRGPLPEPPGDPSPAPRLPPPLGLPGDSCPLPRQPLPEPLGDPSSTPRLPLPGALGDSCPASRLSASLWQPELPGHVLQPLTAELPGDPCPRSQPPVRSGEPRYVLWPELPGDPCPTPRLPLSEGLCRTFLPPLLWPGDPCPLPWLPLPERPGEPRDVPGQLPPGRSGDSCREPQAPPLAAPGEPLDILQQLGVCPPANAPLQTSRDRTADRRSLQLPREASPALLRPSTTPPATQEPQLPRDDPPVFLQWPDTPPAPQEPQPPRDDSPVFLRWPDTPPAPQEPQPPRDDAPVFLRWPDMPPVPQQPLPPRGNPLQDTHTSQELQTLGETPNTPRTQPLMEDAPPHQPCDGGRPRGP